MAQTYTIDEAAERLGLPADDFKRRLKDEWKSIRSFRDGATLRFRAADIDELARSLGEASDPGLQLAPPGAAPQAGAADEFLLGSDHGSNEQDDIFSMATGEPKKPKSGSDSDVRLEVSKGKRDDAESAMPTEEIALDFSGPASGVLRSGNSSAKLVAPKSGPNLAGPESNRIPGPPASSAEPASTDSSSEFELSLDADSGSFELQLNDSSEEVDIGGSPISPRGAQSGINLNKPVDSGVSLEKNKRAGDDDDSDDFELSLDPTESPSSRRITGPKGGKIPSMSVDSDSEFELTLEDNSGVTDGLAAELQDDQNRGDIFETDFELPAVQDDADSGSEVVALDSSDTDLENSDFDLALEESDAGADDDSASAVVLLDDETASGNASGRSARALAGAAGAAGGAAAARRRKGGNDEDEDSAASALRGVAEDDEETATVPAGGFAPPAKWGALPAAVLLPCFLLTFLGGIMSFETLRGMWGYSQGAGTGGAVTRGVADMVGMELKESK